MSSESGGISENGGGPVRANLPDKLVGIGGAGKTIVKQFMRQKWILQEAMEPRADTGGDPPSEGIDAYILDTATGAEKKDDQTDIDEINDLIRTEAAEYSIRQDQVLTEIQYLNPFEKTTPRYRRLTTKGPVRDIMESRGLEAWWLENNDDMMVDDYSEGVIRRRALSKAVFQASQMQSSSLGDLMTPGTDNDAAIVVGLGGGTGSGMFIDLAEELDDVVEQVNLYAIVPGLTEQKELRANAYAALSEIEHLSLNNESPFKNVILLPFGPTENVDQMQEFYDGVANTIVAHYNMKGNQPDRLDENSGGGFGVPDYAPFTIATPQTLRFEVGDIRTARDKVETFIDERLQSLETEHELYEVLEQFVLDTYSDEQPAENLEQAINGNAQSSDTFNLGRETASNLRERLENLNKLLDMQVLHQLDNEAADTWRERLRQRTDNELSSYDPELSEAEKNEMLVTNVASVVHALDEPEDEGYRDESEERLAKFVRSELNAILRRANLYRTASVIDDRAVTDAIENALHEDRSALAGGDEASKKRKTFANAIENTETNLTLLEDYIDSELDPLLEDRIKEWKQSVEIPLEQLNTLSDSREQIDALLGDLENAITQAVAEIREANSSRAIDQNPLTFDRFNELNEHLEAAGLNPIDDHRIHRSLQNSARAHEVWLDERNKGVLSSFNPLDNADPEGDYFGYRNSIDNSLISIPETFEPEFDFDIQYVGSIRDRADDLDNQRETLLDETVSTFENLLQQPGVTGEHFTDTLEGEWESEIAHQAITSLPSVTWPGDVADLPQELRAQLERDTGSKSTAQLLDDLCSVDSPRGGNFVYRGFYSSIIEPVDDIREHLESHYDELTKEQQRYTQIVAINKEEGAAFAEEGTGPGRPDTAYDQRADTEFQYVKRAAPDAPHRLLSKDDVLDAELWERENFTIESTFTNEFVPNITGLNERLPLVTGKIEGPSDDHDDPFYTHHRFINIFMSRAFPGKKDDAPGGTDVFDQIETGYRRGIHVPEGDDGYTEAWVPFGAPWDVSMVSFLGGVFLDNLNLISSDNGFKAAYEDQRQELRESVRVRHSHGLDGTDTNLTPSTGEGAFVYREEVLQLNKPSDHDKIVSKNEGELVSLFEEMQKVERFDSTVSLDGDDDEESEIGSEESDTDNLMEDPVTDSGASRQSDGNESD